MRAFGNIAVVVMLIALVAVPPTIGWFLLAAAWALLAVEVIAAVRERRREAAS